MTHVARSVARRRRLQPAEGRSLAFWGVVMLATTEGVLFVVLLFSWFYVWARAPQWPPPGVELPELRMSAVRTVVLLSTSLATWRAEHALQHGHRGRTWAWVGATLAGSGWFLATHVHEFATTVPAEFLWSDHVYGSLWWTILNLHGAHVAVGIMLWVFVLVRLGRGRYGPDEMVEFSTTSLYWHFVDVVWVLVYPSLYLLPNLLAGTS